MGSEEEMNKCFSTGSDFACGQSTVIFGKPGLRFLPLKVEIWKERKRSGGCAC